MWEMKYYLALRRRGISCMKISKRKADWIGHILRRNCRLQRVAEGKIKAGIEMTRRRGRRRRKLLDDLKERRGCSLLKEEALDRTVWRARFGRGFGPVVRQTTKWMNNIKFWVRNERVWHHRYLTLSLYDTVAPQADKPNEYQRWNVYLLLLALIWVWSGSH